MSRDAAYRYYRAQHEGKEAMDRKLREGSIHIGVPHLKAGEKLTRIDGGKRYAITEP